MNDTLALCHNQVMAFFRDLDENSYDDLVQRLAPDGVWLRQGKTLTGPVPLTGVESLRSTHIELTRSKGQWLIARMANDEPSFAAPAA